MIEIETTPDTAARLYATMAQNLSRHPPPNRTSP